MIDATWFRRVAPKIRDLYRHWVFDRGEDTYGHKWEPYSTYPSKWVMINIKKSERKSAPKGGYSYKEAKSKGILKRQAGDSKGSPKPYLSGDLKNDFSVMRMGQNSMTLGFASRGHIVKGLAKKKRYLSAPDQPLHPNVVKGIEQELKKAIDGGIPKNQIINIKVGK